MMQFMILNKASMSTAPKGKKACDPHPKYDTYCLKNQNNGRKLLYFD